MGLLFPEKSLTLQSNSNKRTYMKKILMTYAAVLCCTMAMALTTPTISWKYSDHFPKLPPLTVDFDMSLYHHSQPNLMQMSFDNKQDKDTSSSQSIMFRHKEKKLTSQYHYESRPDYSKKVDNLGDIRDRIVRDRRVKEGIPLQPLPPPLMRNRNR